MKRTLLTTLLTITLFLGASTGQVANKIHAMTHSIHMETVFHSAGCSATAIGRHALLTATHCELPTSEIEVDGNDATIVGTLRDKGDHTILFLKGIEFDVWAEWATTRLVVGDEVFMYGNPGKMKDIFRRGILVSEFPDLEVGMVQHFQMPSYFGDSGAGIFDKSGKLVAVLSFGETMSTGSGESFSLTGAFNVGFTKEDFATARAF